MLAGIAFAADVVPEVVNLKDIVVSDDPVSPGSDEWSEVFVGDGSRGLPEHAPFDRILVSAAPETVPSALVEPLAPLGRIAIPIGGDRGQTLVVGKKDADGKHVLWERDVPCMFVPLVET